MEALLSQFAFLSDEALRDKNFDPSTIEDLMKLFEIEAYKSWVAMELEQEKAEIDLAQAERDLDSVMESAMDEFRRFEEGKERMSKEELSRLEETAERERKMGKLTGKAAIVASKIYIEAATASMKSASKGISSNKVHPN
ncbi:hypothetical protein HS088_TW08G00504 [Tripterygium wilfordii]|uniref:Maternal effect embryo arrest 9 n=1 Tax=Tripterygium wilfordii TaxID=458696 RepID=A0A7J7DCX3_TRIWF|nr:uncharacterized protein LOC120004336 [Tripterygium wilfordii]KAF5743916.1 hypothetical protein HS088_TW08G00504 [Tripterygium wilfordii]